MRRIQLKTAHHIMFCLWVSVTCVFVGILALDTIAVLKHVPLRLFSVDLQYPWNGVSLLFDGVMVLIPWYMALRQRKKGGIPSKS